MSSTHFSTSELGQYYDLLYTPATGAPATTPEEANIISILRLLILEQGNTTEDIISKINNGLKDPTGVTTINNSSVKEVFNKVFTIIHDGSFISGVEEKKKKTLSEILNGKTLNPSNSSKLSLIQSNSSLISPMTREINNVILFFNSIPSVELSRSVPFIDIKTKTTRASVVDGKVQSLSLFRFLNGTDKVESGYGDLFSSNPEKFHEAGMELFTSPQTLVNADFSDPSNEKRAVPVIDIFRPLMSIENLEIKTISSGQSIISYKSGKLNIVLHDRSRLSEIAEFVKPDMYSGVELTITYGWSHPDGPEKNNVYGDLINSMKKTEKYRVTNSSFAFTDTGEVKIALTIFALGAYELSLIQIAESRQFRNSQKKLQELSATISEYRVSSGLIRSDQNKEVRAIQVLDAAETYTTQHEFTPEVLNKIDEIIKKLKGNINKKEQKANSESFKQLTTDLEALFGSPNQEGNISGGNIEKQLGLSIDAILREKFKRLENFAIEDDPFVEHQFVETDIQKEIEIENKKKNTKTSRKLVSLARIIAIFVGEAIAETAEGFDEVQFIFYPANSQAGKARGKNLGGFLIELEVFRELFTKEAHVKGTSNFQLQEFLVFVSSNFVDDPRSFMYGTRILYKGRDKNDPHLQLTDEAKSKNSTFFNTTMQNVMDGVGGEFMPAQISMYVEAVPPTVVEDGDDKTKQDKRTIVKIHIFDTKSSPYQTQKQILASDVDGLISQIGTKDTNEDLQNIDKLNDIFSKAVSEGVIKIADDGTPIAAVNGRAIKEFIKRTTPTITYGTNASIIKQAGLATLQEKELVTINIMQYMNSAGGSALQPASAGFGGIPMFVVPAQLDMEIFGCPLIEFAQQVFFDFGTGTKIDNLYAVVEITHNISAGKFSSKCRWVPLDSYGKYSSLISKLKQQISVMKKN